MKQLKSLACKKQREAKQLFAHGVSFLLPERIGYLFSTSQSSSLGSSGPFNKAGEANRWGAD